MPNSFLTRKRMPVLFLGHGNPMNAIEENQFVQGFRDIAKTLPQPDSILCISAHWYIRGTKVTAMELPQTIHDFGGFPRALFDVQYPAKGNPALANDIINILSPYEVEPDYSWGLDHGTWSVVKHLYPDADVPVVQLSIDYTKSAQYHFELAKKLAYLRDNGVLIIGSGNIVHNLSLVDWRHFDKDDYGYDWAIEAKEFFNHCLLEGNYQPLIEYQRQSDAIQLAIPGPDHFLPLLYALALKRTDESLVLFNDKLVAGSLSMTSCKIG